MIVATCLTPILIVGLALVQAYAHGVELDFIDPGKPMQNGYQESCNGKFRDECLDLHWFLNLEDARRIIGRWEEGYNTTRPHSALGN